MTFKRPSPQLRGQPSTGPQKDASKWFRRVIPRGTVDPSEVQVQPLSNRPLAVYDPKPGSFFWLPDGCVHITEERDQCN